MVMRDSFRQALMRARQGHDAAGSVLRCGGEGYHLMQSLGSGEISQVYLAKRIGRLPFLATVKVSSASVAAARYAREAEVLCELQSSHSGAASIYAAQRLPAVIAQGLVEGAGARHALVLRHPIGYWGSLAALSERFSQGIDPRHAVWIWRRMLDVLHFLHAQGWAHGDVRPEHALVHAPDHGILLIGWASAQKGAGEKTMVADLLRCARVVRVLISGAGGSGVVPQHVPAGLAELLTRASNDESFCRTHGAQGLDALLRTAAQEAFGAPSFLTLDI
jgi:serine/threonine protein kinase